MFLCGGLGDGTLRLAGFLPVAKLGMAGEILHRLLKRLFAGHDGGFSGTLLGGPTALGLAHHPRGGLIALDLGGGPSDALAVEVWTQGSGDAPVRL